MANDEQIKAMVYRASQKFARYLDPTDLESEVNYTLFRVWRLHSEKRGKVSTYLYNALYHNLKRLCGASKAQEKLSHVNQDIFLDNKSMTPASSEILDGLEKEEKKIVMDYVVENKSFNEMAKERKETIYKTIKEYERVIEKLKK
jgi:DNA-directed RNA polymerase specialized sigma24 family protein